MASSGRNVAERLANGGFMRRIRRFLRETGRPGAELAPIARSSLFHLRLECRHREILLRNPRPWPLPAKPPRRKGNTAPGADDAP